MNVTDLQYAAMLGAALMAVLGLDMVVAKRNERRWEQRRRQLALRKEMRRHEVRR